MLSFRAKVDVMVGAANGTLNVKLAVPEPTGLKPALPDLIAVT
jgi:hypothetical protein